MSVLDDHIRLASDAIGAEYLHTTQADANAQLGLLDRFPVIIRSFPSTTTTRKFIGEMTERGAVYMCISKGDSFSDIEADVMPDIQAAIEYLEQWRVELLKCRYVQAVKIADIVPFRGLLSSNLIGVRADVSFDYVKNCR